jgi:hypothetical protein
VRRRENERKRENELSYSVQYSKVDFTVKAKTTKMRKQLNALHADMRRRTFVGFIHMAPTNVANPTRAFIPIKQSIIAIRLD